MSKTSQTLEIKCPHCGYVRKVAINIDDITAEITRGFGDDALATARRGSQTISAVLSHWNERMREAVKQIVEKMSSESLKEANEWVDMPPCPNCQHEYRFNVRTGEVTE